MRLTRISQLLTRISDPRWVVGLAASALVVFLPASTESAIANGDTRTISLFHAHTHESITATFKVDGQYDNAVLEKLNWFLRDWRRDEAIKMDPHLFDTVWEVYRESGSQQPIEVMSAYRSPQTNAMLRRRSRAVAEHSQHILGKAMDQHYMDVPMSRIRELGMRLQRGGVGFYPTAGTPFVHLDVGGVRHWPRMSYDQLARLFPDGKTVHIPSNGQPLARYEEARAELESRGDGSYPTATEVKSKGFFAWLFGGGSDEDDDNAQAGIRTKPTRVASADPRPTGNLETGSYGNRASSAQSFFSADPPRVAFPSAPPPQAAAPSAALPPPVVAAPPPAAQQPDQSPETDTRTAAVPPSPRQAFANAVAADPRTAEPADVSSMDLSGTSRADAASGSLLPGSLAPLPPRRPSELAFFEQGAPLPPARPTLSGTPAHDAARPASPDAIGSLIANSAGRLPALITQGPGGTGPARRPVVALGYAAQPMLGEGGTAPSNPAVPVPVARPANLVSPHLDRSNFRALTRPDTTARSVTRSALGTVVPPVRAAARGNPEAFVPLPSTRPATFQSNQPGLNAERFSGSAGRTSAQNRVQMRTGID